MAPTSVFGNWSNWSRIRLHLWFFCQTSAGLSSLLHTAVSVQDIVPSSSGQVRHWPSDSPDAAPFVDICRLLSWKAQVDTISLVWTRCFWSSRSADDSKASSLPPIRWSRFSARLAPRYLLALKIWCCPSGIIERGGQRVLSLCEIEMLHPWVTSNHWYWSARWQHAHWHPASSETFSSSCLFYANPPFQTLDTMIRWDQTYLWTLLNISVLGETYFLLVKSTHL